MYSFILIENMTKLKNAKQNTQIIVIIFEKYCMLKTSMFDFYDNFLKFVINLK